MNKSLNIEKIIKNIDQAIKDKDYVKMMEIHDLIKEATEEDQFRCYLNTDGETGLELNISKDFQKVVLTLEEMKEIYEQLRVAKDFNWKLPF